MGVAPPDEIDVQYFKTAFNVCNDLIDHINGLRPDDEQMDFTLHAM
jgi:hypothetical protein